ncbi:MAG: hypothetical protein IK127_03400 [Clostridia bacterium]|nr:hypothetical protein [Clostridia bacterium]
MQNESNTPVEKKEKRKRSPWKKAVIIFGIIVLFISLVLLGGRIYFRLSVKEYYNASEAAFAIPGLSEGFVPQGLTYDEEADAYLVGGYMKAKDAASPVYTVDKKTGELKAHASLANADGSAFTGHAGGLAVWDCNVYVAGSGCVYLFDRDEILTAKDGTQVQCLGQIDTPLTADDALGIAWVNISTDGGDTLMTVGEFYKDPEYPTPESHKFSSPSGERLQALAVTYRLSEDGGSLTPLKAYALPDLVQGFADYNGKIWLSTSWGTGFSHIYTYEEESLEAFRSIDVNGTTVPLFALDSAARTADYKIAPMAEEIVFTDGKLLTMCESASRKYYFGLLTGAQWCYATDLSKMMSR